MNCSFNKDLPSICHMWGTVLGRRDKNETRHNPPSVNLQFIILRKQLRSVDGYFLSVKSIMYLYIKTINESKRIISTQIQGSYTSSDPGPSSQMSLHLPLLSDEPGCDHARGLPGRWVDMASLLGQSIILAQKVLAAGYEQKKKCHSHSDRTLGLWQKTAKPHSIGTHSGPEWECPETILPQPVCGEAVLLLTLCFNTVLIMYQVLL